MDRAESGRPTVRQTTDWAMDTRSNLYQKKLTDYPSADPTIVPISAQLKRAESKGESKGDSKGKSKAMPSDKSAEGVRPTSVPVLLQPTWTVPPKAKPADESKAKPEAKPKTKQAEKSAKVAKPADESNAKPADSVNTATNLVKLKLKVKKMTAEEFTARASGLKAKIATMLGISASRIEITLKHTTEPTVARRLLVVPLEELELDAKSQSEIDVTVKDATGTEAASEPDAEAVVSIMVGKTAVELSNELAIDVVEPAIIEPAANPRGPPARLLAQKTAEPAAPSSNNTAATIGGIAAGVVGVVAILSLASYFYAGSKRSSMIRRLRKEHDAEFKKAVDSKSAQPKSPEVLI